jgi:tRNA 2-selenouridine synthase
MVPPALWSAMLAAPRITIAAPAAARAAYLAREYADVVADRPAFEASLARLPIFPGRKAIARWLALADAGELEALAADLVAVHYDAAYDRAERKDPRARLARVEMAGLGEADLAAAADDVAAVLAGLA